MSGRNRKNTNPRPAVRRSPFRTNVNPGGSSVTDLGTGGSGGVTGKLPFANIQDIATAKILGRATAGTGVIEVLTLSQILDFIGAAAQGDILFRGAAGWQRLAAGTSGQFLQTRGNAADPVWAGALTPGSDASLYANGHFLMHASGKTASSTILVGSQAAHTYIGTVAAAIHEANYQSCVSGAAAGQNAGVAVPGSPPIDWSFPFDITFIIRTGSDITNNRIWIGLSSSGIGNGDTAAQRSVAFRYSTNVPDGGWVGVNYDGTTQSVTATVAAIAASTRYKLRIRSDGTQSWFSVNGGAEVNLNTNFPGGATPVSITAFVYNINASAHTIEFARAFGFYGA